MKRVVAAVLAVLLLALAAAPAVLAAEPSVTHGGRVLISTDGDITIGPSEQADFVLVVRGTARVAGSVNTIVVIDGAAELTGATAESIVAVRSPVELGAGTRVLGDVRTFDALVHKTGDASVGGSVRDLAADVAGLGLILAPALVLVYIGFALAMIVAGLALAGLAARQVRAAGALIAHEPMQVLVAAILGVFVPIAVIALLFVSIVGIPLAIALIVGVWPAVALLGYLVAGIWLGELIVTRMWPTTRRERPYLAAVVGLVVLQLFAVWPPIGFIASLFGYGAVTLAAWRVFRHHGTGDVAAPGFAPMPMAG